MRSAKDYQPNQAFALLLQGAPGQGKTSWALRFPKPYIFDADNNLSGAIRRLRGQGQDHNILYDIGNVDDDGKEVLENATTNRYTRMSKCLIEAVKSPDVQTIIVDSASALSDYMMTEVLRQANRKQMTVPDWGSYLFLFKNLITQVRSQGKLFVMTAHEKPEKDEVSGIIQYEIALPGQIRHVIGGMFSDVWRAEITEKGGKYEYALRTMPTIRLALKNSLELPPVVTDWSVIADKMGFAS